MSRGPPNRATCSLETWICPAVRGGSRFETATGLVELRESEVRILATTGAFRVVPAKDSWTAADGR